MSPARTRALACLTVVLALITTGCKELQKVPETSHTSTPPPAYGVPAPLGVAVTVTRGVALVSWHASHVGSPATGFELTLDRSAPVRVGGRVRTYGFPGLRPASSHVVRVVTLRGTARSAATSVTFSLPSVLYPARPTSRPVVPTRSAPTGKVLIDSFERLPPSQQTHYGCDRLLVTLVNRSTATVDAVTVGFATYWYPEGSDPPPAQPGRSITVSKKVTLIAGAKQQLPFEVCLPDKKTRHVLAQPVATSWTWTRG